MKTPQEIADEALVGEVHIQEWSQDGMNSVVTFGGPGEENWFLETRVMPRPQAQALADDLRLYLARLVQGAVEKALTQCPVPPDISEESLDQILDATDIKPALAAAKVCDILVAKYSAPQIALMLLDAAAHLKHIHRIMHTPESQAIAEAYDQGRRDQHASDVDAIQYAMKDWTRVDLVQSAIGSVVTNAPGKKS